MNGKKKRRALKNKQFESAVQSSFQADEVSQHNIEENNLKNNDKKHQRTASQSLQRNTQEQTAGGQSVQSNTLPRPYQFLKFATPSIHMIFFPHFTIKSVNFVLSVLLVILFIVLIAFNFSKQQNDFTWNCSLFQLQNKFFPRLRYDYQFWRVLVSGFFHSNIAHFCLNLFGLQVYGYFVEWYYGKLKYILVLSVSLIMSHFFSAAVQTESVSTMASSHLYCIIALKIWFLYQYRQYKALQHRKTLIWLLLALITGINLIPIFVVNNVDFTAHLGGLITGGLFGMYFHFDKDQQQRIKNQQIQYDKKWKVLKWTSLLLLPIFLITCIVIVFTTDSDTLYAMNYKIDEKCL